LIDDVHEPVELYKTFFKSAHARHTSEFFENLVRQSGIDELANIKTVEELGKLEKQVASENSTNLLWRILRGAVVAAFVIALIYVFMSYAWPWLIGPVVLFLALIYKLNQVVKAVNLRLQLLEKQRDAKREEAWQQMAALNRLFDWDIVAKLVNQTVPRLALDPYFSNGRLDELRNTFGWDDKFNSGRSVTFSHSGVLNGNPFVLARTLDHWMGSKTYHGSLSISWTEQERGSDNKWHTVTKHETLNASLERAYPVYGNRTFIIYGNEAASELSFSRTPSDLSKLDEGAINNWKKRRAIKKLEVKSREIIEGKSFTVMSNREFDALFGATDRDHEVQFRLLFTPLAQQEMLNLLKDKNVGYGDNFEFTKQRMINLVEPAHMMATDIEVEPTKFFRFELDASRKFFNKYNNDFFKSFYFGIAPLLAIPLYQQHRPHNDIYKDVHSSRSCFWEHEAIANYFGEKEFQHPNCVTRSILKTQSKAESDGTQTINVTANGYEGMNRVNYVSVYGGDGRYHDVRVDWIEYIEVQQFTNLVVCEKLPSHEDVAVDMPEGDIEAWKTMLKHRGVEPHQTILRRSIVSAIAPHL
jgi:hypothetical protein